jgi:hypothetical protein
MSLVYVAGLAITVGLIALVGLVGMICLMASTMEIRTGLNRMRESSEPCGRCAPHQHCHAVAWCAERAEWMCMQCWFACTVGAYSQSQARQHSNEKTLEIVRAVGPPPNGFYMLFCDEEGSYAHDDGCRGISELRA